MSLFKTPRIPVPPPPDPEKARRRAEAEQRKINQSKERFLVRQGTMGSSQLTAPTLRY